MPALWRLDANRNSLVRRSKHFFNGLLNPGSIAARASSTLGRTASLLTLLACGCARSPARVEPTLPWSTPRAWIASELVTDESVDVVGTRAWWRLLGDRRLEPLVTEALEGNADLRVVAARVEQAAAQAAIRGADALPQVGVGLAGSRAQQNFVGLPIPGASGGVLTSRFENYGVSLDVSWELDLWGRIRAGQSASLSDTEAARDDLDGAMQSLIGQLAKAWFASLEARRQTEVSRRNVESFELTVARARSRFESGSRSSLDVHLAESSLALARARLAGARRRERSARRQLELLLGRYPAAEIEVAAGFPRLDVAVPDVLPADLIARRPDLAAAERRLAAANARVRSARAALYPRISLTASGGTSSNELSDLVDGDFSVWNLAANALQPVFQGGRLLAGIDLARAQEQEATAAYARAALTAYAEVESALDAEASLRIVERELERAHAESTAALERARDRYARGLEELVTLLSAERQAFDTESQLLDAHRQRVDARIDLHLALGGGFRSRPESPTSNDTPLHLVKESSSRTPPP